MKKKYFKLLTILPTICYAPIAISGKNHFLSNEYLPSIRQTTPIEPKVWKAKFRRNEEKILSMTNNTTLNLILNMLNEMG
uniref:hypothetical protein n=1 Tax=Mycoplasmopsis bovigenitalium TaxID=2112 RepID=UPI00101C7F03|nr:hypothetical protein [Mycoplasmopsis bovigenitalium]